eukprot:symbB.v1.2.028593.t1/scaffold3046.1/size64741/3
MDSPRTPTKKLKELLVSEGMILPGSICFTSNACKSVNGSMFTKGDYVLIQQGQGHQLCCVVTALMLIDIVYVVVSACQLLTHSPEKKSSTWEDKPLNLELAFASHVLCPVIWHKSATNEADGFRPTVLFVNVLVGVGFLPRGAALEPHAWYAIEFSYFFFLRALNFVLAGGDEHAWGQDGYEVFSCTALAAACAEASRGCVKLATKIPCITSDLPNHWDDDSAFLQAFEADADRLWTTWQLSSYATDMKPSCSAAQRGTPEAFSYADTNYLLLGLMIELKP